MSGPLWQAPICSVFKRLNYLLKSKIQEIPAVVAASLIFVTCWLLIPPLGLRHGFSVPSGASPTPPGPQPEDPELSPAASHLRFPSVELANFSSCPPPTSHGAGLARASEIATSVGQYENGPRSVSAPEEFELGGGCWLPRATGAE